MKLEDSIINDYVAPLKAYLEKEIEHNIEKTLLFACNKLRPDLDPIKFVEDCRKQAEWIWKKEEGK